MSHLFRKNDSSKSTFSFNSCCNRDVLFLTMWCEYSLKIVRFRGVLLACDVPYPAFCTNTYCNSARFLKLKARWKEYPLECRRLHPRDFNNLSTIFSREKKNPQRRRGCSPQQKWGNAVKIVKKSLMKNCYSIWAFDIHGGIINNSTLTNCT